MALRTAQATLGWLESSGALGWLRAAFWPWGGRLRILPVGGYRGDVTPAGGVRLATDLLLGPRRRAGVSAWVMAGDARIFGAGGALHPLGLALPGRPPLRRRVTLTLSGAYTRQEDIPFRGAGYQRAAPSPAPLPRTRYGARRAEAVARLGVRLWAALRLGMRLGFERRRLEDGRRTEDAIPLGQTDAYGTDLPAFGEDVDAARAALSLRWGDPVDAVIAAPGLRAALRATVWAGRSDALPLLGLSARLEAFTALGSRWRRLGLRALTRAVAGLRGQPVPLTYLPRLGGLQTMRGFPLARFQGESVAWVTAEYQAALHPRLWLSLFVDWGAACREAFSGWGWRRIDVSGGGALHLRIAPGYWLRLQVAGSREGPEVWLGLRAEAGQPELGPWRGQP